MVSEPLHDASRPLKRLRMDVEADATEREVDTAEVHGAGSAAASPPIKKALLPFIRLVNQDIVKQDIVKILVGDPAHIYQVPEKLLSKCSAFFDAAINSTFKEAIDKEVVLGEEDPLTFEVFLNWLYTSSLPTLAEYFEVPIKDQRPLSYLLLSLYAMSDRLIVPRLKSVAYKAIREVFQDKHTPVSGFIDELYEITSPDDQLRRYFVAMCTHDLLNPNSAPYWIKIIETNDRFATDVLIAKHKDSSSNHVPIDPYHMEQYNDLREEKDLRVVLREPPMQNGDASNLPGKQHELITDIFDNMGDMLNAGSCPNSVKWPHAQPSISAMRAAGFFHSPTEIQEDQVKCVNCGLTISNWVAEDKPLKKHREASPECPFVEAVELGLEPPLLPYFCMPRNPEKSG